MTDHDPRTDTGIPTEPAGSLPRPAKLQAASAEYDAGNISKKIANRVEGTRRAAEKLGVS